MFAGVGFADKFTNDNFNIRRSMGNWYDPESLISGKEIARGMTYKNSKRNWVAEFHYLEAVEGRMSVEDILATAPREFTPMTPWDFVEEEDEGL